MARLALRRTEAGGPNYGLRRLGAVALAALAALVVWRLGAAAFGSNGTGEPGAGDSSPRATASASPTAAALQSCTFAKTKAPRSDYSDWAFTLVDTRFRLTPDYVPPNLVSVQRAGFHGEFQVRSELTTDLRALREAAEAAGNPIDVVAAYRSYPQQKSLFDRRVEDVGYEDAIRKTALPGHSEHQLGTAVDFKTLGAKDVSQRWASTPAGRWVAENADLFGFVQSYPDGKVDVTCYAYEPWHYRYFGPDLAGRIVESGLTVREYLWNVQEGFIRP